MLCSQRRRVGFLFPASLRMILKDQFTFSTCVTGVDDLVDVGPFEQSLDQMKRACVFSMGLRSK